jgi:hypothetical protein
LADAVGAAPTAQGHIAADGGVVGRAGQCHLGVAGEAAFEAQHGNVEAAADVTLARTLAHGDHSGHIACVAVSELANAGAGLHLGGCHRPAIDGAAAANRWELALVNRAPAAERLHVIARPIRSTA